MARRCVALLLLALSAADALRVSVRAGRVPGLLQLSVSKFQTGAVCARCRPPTMTSSSENAAMIESLVAEVSAMQDESERQASLEQAVRSWGGLRSTLADDFAAECKSQITALQAAATERHENGEDTSEDQARLQNLVSTWIGSRVFLQRVSSEGESEGESGSS